MITFLSFQLCDKYHSFVTDSEREQFTTRLQEVEDWLYEDGEDETKGVYIAKLEELKKVRFSFMDHNPCSLILYKVCSIFSCSKVIPLKSATRSPQRGVP